MLCEHVYVFNTLAYYEKCVSGIDNFKGEGVEAGIDNFKTEDGLEAGIDNFEGEGLLRVGGRENLRSGDNLLLLDR